MTWEALSVTTPSVAYTALGGFVVAFSMISLVVRERLYMNEVLLGTTLGIVLGPYVGKIFDPRDWSTHSSNAVTLEVMRVVLATGLFAIGVELPKSYLLDHVRGLLVLVVPTMAFGWAVIATITHFLFPNLDFISSLAIAACLTPTDPVISASIVGGKFAEKHVPISLRRLLLAESAANDGLAYPFLTVSLYLVLESSRLVAMRKWFLIGCLYQVIFGTTLGAILGYSFSKLMRYSHRKGFINQQSYVAQYFALVFLTIGVASTIGTDDLLACFAAGTAISWDGHFNDQVEDDSFSAMIDLLLNCACFIYIGAWLPFASFNVPELGILPYRLALLFLSVMVLRRIPALLILYRFVPEITNWKEALFSGHFGPMGVGALFMSSFALHLLPETSNSVPGSQREILAATLQPIVSFVVLGSIVIHGLSIPFFTVGREIHTRTHSITASRTMLSRDGPDWLSGINRAPAAAGIAIDTTVTTSVEIDLERAGASNKETVVRTGSVGMIVAGTNVASSSSSSSAPGSSAQTPADTSEVQIEKDLDVEAHGKLRAQVHFPADQ